jgi:N-hydroxyarylamine O-acetyltransferase
MDVPAYLARISYTGPTTPDADTLRGIHRAHMLSVPFENLDIPLKRKIVCDENAFVRKIVEQRRGGFCYELNGAFAALLRALGFPVTLLSARVMRDDGNLGPEMDHLALQVDLDEPWLADVGFGDSFVEPLRLQVRTAQDQDGRGFRIVSQDDIGRDDELQMQVCRDDLSWKTEYSFGLQPRQLKEFAAMCEYHQTSPESPFTHKRLCSRATPDGRVTLADMKLITTCRGVREERILGSQEEWRETLQEQFGVVL